MQLRGARLGLDCEEAHTDQQCPGCACERVGYLSRWVPVEERRVRQRPRERPTPEREAAVRWAKRGAAGIALVAVSRWLWSKRGSLEQAERTVRESDKTSRSA